MSRQKLAERLQGTVENRCAQLAESASQGVAEYDARCEKQLIEQARGLEERLEAHRQELEELYARRAAHELVNAQRRREGQLVEDALASIQEKLVQLPTADPARYGRYLHGLLDKILAEREGPMVVLTSPRDFKTVQRACAEISEVEVEEEPRLHSGLQARETTTNGFVDASLDGLFRRSRGELGTRLMRVLFGNTAQAQAEASDA